MISRSSGRLAHKRTNKQLHSGACSPRHRIGCSRLGRVFLVFVFDYLFKQPLLPHFGFTNVVIINIIEILLVYFSSEEVPATYSVVPPAIADRSGGSGVCS